MGEERFKATEATLEKLQEQPQAGPQHAGLIADSEQRLQAQILGYKEAFKQSAQTLAEEMRAHAEAAETRVLEQAGKQAEEKIEEMRNTFKLAQIKADLAKANATAADANEAAQ